MSKSHSTSAPPTNKPIKPSPDFPLTIHPAGYFSKKIRGKVWYFGRWDEGPDVALRRYHDEKDDLLAGRVPKTREVAVPSGSPQKPAKPSPDFPLTVHPCGYYSKKIRGKVHYFGRWDEGPDAALARWNEQKEDLLAGREPKSANERPEGYTVRDLLGDYELFKRRQRDQERITSRTYLDCKDTCHFLAEHIDGGRLVSDVGPRDFAKLLDALMAAKRKGKKKSMVVLGNAITRVKSVFHFAKREGKLVRDVVFGSEFVKPPDASVERQKAEAVEAEGQRTFGREEVLAILGAAAQPLKAMVLLAVNCGLGNSDVGQLRRAHLNLETGWLTYPRPKTMKPRRCKLWPETVEALRAWLEIRPAVKDPDHDRLVFITKYGLPWHKEATGENPLSSEFKKVTDSLGIDGHRNFYALRATFRTEAGRCADLEALLFSMGHSLPGMSKHYVKDVHDDRLEKVAQTVRSWLFAPPA